MKPKDVYAIKRLKVAGPRGDFGQLFFILLRYFIAVRQLYSTAGFWVSTQFCSDASSAWRSGGTKIASAYSSVVEVG